MVFDWSAEVVSNAVGNALRGFSNAVFAVHEFFFRFIGDKGNFHEGSRHIGMLYYIEVAALRSAALGTDLVDNAGADFVG